MTHTATVTKLLEIKMGLRVSQQTGRSIQWDTALWRFNMATNTHWYDRGPNEVEAVLSSPFGSPPGPGALSATQVLRHVTPHLVWLLLLHHPSLQPPTPTAPILHSWTGTKDGLHPDHRIRSLRSRPGSVLPMWHTTLHQGKFWSSQGCLNSVKHSNQHG